MFGARVTPKRSFTIVQAVGFVDELIPILLLETLIYQAQTGFQEFAFHLFKFTSTKYWYNKLSFFIVNSQPFTTSRL
jgi:hypothetical protein